jgi:mevalonate pyrophosphate decarboxylase
MLKDIIQYLYNMSTNVTSTSSIAVNTTNNTSTEFATTNLEQIMNNISANLNPKTSEEGLQMLYKPDEIIARLQEGSKQFERQVGRQMTYSEMRQMFG